MGPNIANQTFAAGVVGQTITRDVGWKTVNDRSAGTTIFELRTLPTISLTVNNGY
jgi:hypothetical protein